MENIDLEEGKIKVGNEWLTEDEIRYAIKMKVESDDYNVADLAVALKTLIEEMNKSTVLRVRVQKEMAEEFERISQETGESPETMFRILLLEYINKKEQQEEETFDELEIEGSEEDINSEDPFGDEENTDYEEEEEEEGLVDIKGMVSDLYTQDAEITGGSEDEIEEVETVELGGEEAEEIVPEEIEIEDVTVEEAVEPETIDIDAESIEIEDGYSKDVKVKEDLGEEIDVDLEEPVIDEIEIDEVLEEVDTSELESEELELEKEEEKPVEEKIKPVEDETEIQEALKEEGEIEETAEIEEELKEDEEEEELPSEKKVKKKKSILRKKKIRLRRT
jgi:hypothetical protein